jgi:hypothetical protein
MEVFPGGYFVSVPYWNFGQREKLSAKSDISECHPIWSYADIDNQPSIIYYKRRVRQP